MKDLRQARPGRQAEARGVPGRRLLDLQPRHVRHQGVPAVINPPQACILAVGAGEQRPVVKDGALAVATVMSCTLSVDHRVGRRRARCRVPADFKRLIEKTRWRCCSNGPESGCGSILEFDIIVIGGGPGGYVAAIRAGPARHEDRARRARAPGRHLPQLGLHPDQGAAALGRGRRICCTTWTTTASPPRNVSFDSGEGGQARRAASPPSCRAASGTC